MYKFNKWAGAGLCLALIGSLLPRLDARSAEPDRVVINELMWMGSSASALDEWIELSNLTDQAVDLSNWLLTKKTSGNETPMLVMPTGASIPAHGFYLIANYGADSASSRLGVQADLVDSDVSLVNSALQIKLYDADSVLIDITDDGSGAPLGGKYTSGSLWQSMERTVDASDGTLSSSWRTATTSVNFDSNEIELGTPRAAKGNSAPVAEAGPDQAATLGEAVLFDASDSADPDGDAIVFHWDFGDGATGAGSTPTHVFKAAGVFTVALTVSDGQAESADSLAVTIIEPDPEPTVPPPDEPEPVVPKPPVSPTQPPLPEPLEPSEEPKPGNAPAVPQPKTAKILINELLPNPQGKDQAGEFIELVSLESAEVSLAGWKLTDGSKTYSFADSASIEAGGFLNLPYATTRLTLKNSGGELKLIDPFGTTVNGVAYTAAKEGQAFARVELSTRWQWTEQPTPGSENEIISTSEDEPDATTDSDQPDDSDEADTTAAASKNSATEPRSISLADLSDLPSRTLVKISGTVTAWPGLFGASSIWISDGSVGVEVVSSNKSFPKLELNDQVELIGTVSTAGIGRRVNLKSGELKIISSDQSLAAVASTIDELTDETIGRLVKVEGSVQSVKGQHLTLSDQNGKILDVFFKQSTGLKANTYSVGQNLEITGLVGWSSGAAQLWPRIKDDIEVLGQVEGAATEASTTPKESVDLIDEQKPASQSWLVMIIVGAMVVTGGVLYLRHRWSNKKEAGPM